MVTQIPFLHFFSIDRLHSSAKKENMVLANQITTKTIKILEKSYFIHLS